MGQIEVCRDGRTSAGEVGRTGKRWEADAALVQRGYRWAWIPREPTSDRRDSAHRAVASVAFGGHVGDTAIATL